MTGERTIGVGLIGTGFMGKCHALAWNAVAPTLATGLRPRLVHLAEADNTLARQRAGEFGFARATGGWRDVVSDPEVDVVSITAPNPLHAEMALAAFSAGKHVWCEKPMATSRADARAMREAARASGRVAALGYNYIQNPAIREMERAIRAGAIGRVNHVRLEMDEDFMADEDAPFAFKNGAASGYGALDDFAVHPLSLVWRLVGPVEAVVADQTRPYPSREGRAVETHEIASALLRLRGGASGTLGVNRAAWGRKGRIALQIFGSRGTIGFDQERMNEFQIFQRDGEARLAGFRTVLAGPVHEPYGRFVPAPGHSLGFNDLKVIEAGEVLAAIEGREARIVDFETGLAIEETIHAMARSHAEGRWIGVGEEN
ncbi:Gfo/Idh/MocA family protein [Aureimonas jatrophae]|uniref:Predicted dehydrogenase n=1 Tax=Aureimonas jatrophae TaxID=1166073 RepID=A0A1H0C5K8_9HYPH|nr:Gfo/Idh/MocA family oxidoreductase [Aureimonas jatrophae]MBB3949077.1 putative dehydrogenase [Aureimonas jatrophae]SDN53141.1 Predicted dehydrogenase [Aureimonas jatrophae]